MDRNSSAAFEAAFRHIELPKKNQQKPHAHLAVSELRFESGTSWLLKSTITRLPMPVTFCYKGGRNKLGVSEFAWFLNARYSVLFRNSGMDFYYFCGLHETCSNPQM